jgi:hypothetical protein
MNSHSLTSEDKTTDIRVAYLLEQLKVSRSPTVGDYMYVFFIAAGVAVVAWFQGYQSFIVCIGLMVLVFTLQAVTEARIKRHMDLLLDLVQELQKKKSRD